MRRMICFLDPGGRDVRTLVARPACAVLVAACVFVVNSPAADGQRTTTSNADGPNIIVIVADDLGYQDLGIQGAPDVATPHLDSVAAAGIRCTHAYVTAPVCSPSRAGFLTGRYQNRFGFEFLADKGSIVPSGQRLGLATSETTIATRLKRLGYATGCIGKWHIGYEEEFFPTNRGFDEFYGSLGQSNYFNPTLVDSRVSNKPRKVHGSGYYLTDDYGRRAIDFVERHRNHKFFLYLPHFAVHKPHEASQRYLTRFRSISDPTRHHYLGMLSAMDDAIGELLSTLRQYEIEDNTMIIFFSDNGGTGGSSNLPLRGKKGATWEGGIRTPFLVQWKSRLPAGRKFDGLISSLDVLPTAIAAAGGDIDPGWKLDGVDLLPYFEGDKSGSPHDSLYWRFGTQWAIRSGTWKLLQAREGKGGTIQIAKQGPVRLYDLASDIAEENDLAAKRPEKVDELRRRWESWNAKLPNPSWKPRPIE